MTLPALLLALLPAGPVPAGPPALAEPPAPVTSPGGTLAIRVARAETVAQGSVEHAVILIENGKITIVGEDLPVERGIPVMDRPEWVAIPGLVDCYTRIGTDGRSSGGFEPQRRASGEILPRQDVWQELLDAGVTTLGIVPDGKGTAGQAVAIRPRGATPEEMILRDPAFLRMEVRTDAGSKKTFREGFEKADDYAEKEAKAREKWEKDQEKKKKKSKSKKKDDDDKDDDKKKDDEDEDEGDDVYVPPEVDPKVQPFLDLRAGTLSAVIGIEGASDWLHLLDALGDEEFAWSLRVPLRDDGDVWNVTEAMGHREKRVIVEPVITLRAHTRREINVPRELAEAGAALAFVPRGEDVDAHEDWLKHVGSVVAEGLDPAVALRAMTLEPAAALGVDERLGSIEAGKDANLVFLSGDPFDVRTRIEAVMLEGEFVSGEVNQ